MPLPPAPPNSECAALAQESDAYYQEHGVRPHITDEPYASANPANREWLVANQYCQQAV